LHTPGNVGNAILRDLGWQSSGVPTPVPSATPTTPAASFSVSGRVTDENGHGIADVFFSYGQGTVTSSDGDGYYTIAGLVAGTYSITPAKSGYNFTPSFRNITIVASDLSGQDFSGVYVPPVTYTVSGKITNAEANPISDVSLSLGGSSVAMTDASGNYSITGLSSGVYTVTPSKLGYTFSPASRAVIITSSDVNGQNFSAASIPTPTFSISGKVKTSQGSAVSGVVISDGAGHSAVTDASGNYGIGGLAAGTYVLVPSKNGYTFLPQSLSVNIIDGNISGQDFVAKALPSGSYSLSGIVTTTGGTPISGVLVSDDIGYSAMTDSNGSYTISGLPAGNFTLGAYKAGYSFAASFENPVVITNANVTNKNFNGLSAPTGNFKISGAISDANGAPLPGVTVSDEKGLYKTVSDGNGNYSLNNLPEGYYVFKAERGSEVFAPAWRTVKISPDAVSQNFTRLEQKIVVNSTADQSDENPGDGKCASVESTCTLRAAIEEANARAKGDIIELPAGTYNLTLGQTNDLSGTLHEADLSGNLVITDTLVIQGDGAASTIIDAKATHSVIEMKQAVSEISVEFNGVTLQNGNGAGVIAQSGDGFLALEGSVVRRNRAPGIWTDGIDVTLDASVLTENSAVDMIGGADVNHGMFTIIESMVINNDGDGGGIHAASGLLMLNSTVSENRGVTQFGGVMVAGGGAIVNSTISNNRGNEGGGIWTMGNLALYNCTVVQNEAVGTGGGDYNSGLGGGLYVYPGSNDISIRNSLLAENKSHNGAADCFGTVTSFGYNLVGDRSGCTFCDAKGDQFGLDAGIDRLEDNGGTTLTFALAWGSWAMDAGNPSGCVDQNGMILNADQRGATRPMDGKNSGSAVCDTGAFEYQPVSMPYEISGLVADEFGVPIPNATISLENGFQTITDKDGLYIIKNLGAGVYHLIARRSGYLLSPPMREVKLPPSRTKQNFVGLRSGNNDGIYTISGRVFDTSENPVAGVYVSLESGESALSDSQGNYFIRGVAAGVHTVTPMLDDYSFKPLKLTVNVGSDVTDKNFIGEKK